MLRNDTIPCWSYWYYEEEGGYCKEILQVLPRNYYQETRFLASRVCVQTVWGDKEALKQNSAGIGVPDLMDIDSFQYDDLRELTHIRKKDIGLYMLKSFD